MTSTPADGLKSAINDIFTELSGKIASAIDANAPAAWQAEIDPLLSPLQAAVDAAIAAAQTTLRVVVMMPDGSVHSYSQDDATYDGRYVGAFVTQDWWKLAAHDLPLTIGFRQDLDAAGNSKRDEVIVELFRMTGFAAAHIDPGYTVEIFKGPVSVFKKALDHHQWGSRWRWQSSKRPIIRQPADIAAVFPALVLSPFVDPAPAGQYPSYLKPMDKAGFPWDATTGDGPWTGRMTRYQAEWMLGVNSASALSTLLAQAEACGTDPIHFRDEKTGQWVSYLVHPYADMGSSIPTARIPQITVNGKLVNDPRYCGPPETSHTPAAAAMAFQITDDPYLLEELHAFGTLAWTFSNFFPSLFKIPGLGTTEQARGFAWSPLRSGFQCAKFTPASGLPASVLPQSYWQAFLGQQRKYCEMIMASPAKIHRTFRVLCHADHESTWQNCFIASELAYGMQLGFAEWRPVFDWFMDGRVAMWTSKFANIPTPYNDVWLRSDKKNSSPLLDTSADSVTYDNWNQVFDAFIVNEAIATVSKWTPDGIYDKASGPAYMHYMRGVLKEAIKLGRADCIPILTRLEATWHNIRHLDGVTFAYDCSKAPGFLKWSAA